MGIIECSNVSYTYKSKYQNVTAVKDISISFEKGKMYSIIGKSGSGKSTLLSLLSGMKLPTNGDVLFQGNSMKKLDLDEYRREKISLVYQDFNLFPRLTALENVMYRMELTGMNRKEAKKKAEELLQKVNVKSHCYKRLPTHLSGGEQQRIAIARSLGTKVDVLLADEPTGSLDTQNGDEIIDLFLKLAREQNYCVIIVTHDLSIAEKSDCVYRMEDGQLLA